MPGRPASRLARAALFAAAALTIASLARPAHAYRPFDGTDADVADAGELELELGPAQLYREGKRNYLVAPATVLNLGLVPDLELVVDFRHHLGLEAHDGEARSRLLDTDVFLKWVLRRGVLQDAAGPSLAVEAGPLVPEPGGEGAFGAQADVILSLRWDGGTVHFNEQAAYARTHEPELFSSVILEGPHELTVRPVSEIYWDSVRGGPTTWSALLGAIWTAHESLTLDAGLRAARVGDEGAMELRLGLTWATPLWEPAARAENAARAPSASSASYRGSRLCHSLFCTTGS